MYFSCKGKQCKIAMILLCPVQGPWASSFFGLDCLLMVIWWAMKALGPLVFICYRWSKNPLKRNGNGFLTWNLQLRRILNIRMQYEIFNGEKTFGFVKTNQRWNMTLSQHWNMTLFQRWNMPLFQRWTMTLFQHWNPTFQRWNLTLFRSITAYVAFILQLSYRKLSYTIGVKYCILQAKLACPVRERGIFSVHRFSSVLSLIVYAGRSL